MGYEFEFEDWDLSVKQCNHYRKLLDELRYIDGSQHLAEELELGEEGYEYNMEQYPLSIRLNLKLVGLYKFYELKKIFEVFNKYCIGTMSLKGENGESVDLEFADGIEYTMDVYVYKRVELDEVEYLKEYLE